MTRRNPDGPPEPENKRAMLVPASTRVPGATVHHYTRTELVVLKDPNGEDSNAWAFIWTCFKTGVERRWGTARLEDDPDADAVSAVVN